MLKIVVDDRIPYIRETLSLISDDVTYIPGAEISAADVRDADALIVRTRTICDEHLLSGSAVQFIATATIGFDHLDTEYLERIGIAWTNCPGCNASSVAQYARCSLIAASRDLDICLKGLTLGVVGCGHVGSKVVKVGEELGLKVLICDPPLGIGVPMSEIERTADIITFHVPLERNGNYPTFHLADGAFFHRLQRQPMIINTSRGAVVDNDALLEALDEKLVSTAIIDTWEGEPSINLELLSRTYIGTPHIAGYSTDGKVNADNMVIAALCSHFGLPLPPPIFPLPLPADIIVTDDPLTLYDPRRDSTLLKAHPNQFETLRGTYPLRRETK